MPILKRINKQKTATRKKCDDDLYLKYFLLFVFLFKI